MPLALSVESCHPKNFRIFFDPAKAISAFYTDSLALAKHPMAVEVDDDRSPMDNGQALTLKHISTLSNTQICYNSWKRVGLVNVKRTAGLAKPKLNYTD